MTIVMMSLIRQTKIYIMRITISGDRRLARVLKWLHSTRDRRNGGCTINTRSQALGTFAVLY